MAPLTAPLDDAGRHRLVRDVWLALAACGGVAGHSELVAATSRHALASAVRSGAVVRVRPGYYALPDTAGGPHASAVTLDAGARAAERAERVHRHRVAATANSAVLSHRSAAEFHQIPLLVEPSSPEMIVAPGRRITAAQRRQAQIRSRSLATADQVDGVTTALRTVLDCAADLPFAEALAVADSALRSDEDHPPLVGQDELLAAAENVRKQSRRQVRLVASAADGRSANPFESALRALARDVPGLHVIPQLAVTAGGRTVKVDLGDERLRIILEADSYTWHGGYDAFDDDCSRYNDLTAEGWHVLRITWKALMKRPEATRQWIHRLTQTRMAALS